MKIQKSIIVLTFSLFALTSMMAANGNSPVSYPECKPLAQLNKTMQAELQLTNEQFEELLALNRKYWISRKNILDTPNKIGINTALLACWDKWQMELSTYLTKAQIEKFMQWQSQVDLLGETPF